MFEHIKKQIAAMNAANDVTSNQIKEAAEYKENELIVECAHLFQELDEVSIDGQEINQFRDVDALNISLEDDPELDSFEISISDGRILDLPGDILVHSESYDPMKSLDDFNNDSNAYNEYLNDIFQEGVFSAEKIDIKDPSIQWTKMVDFGPSNPSDPSSSPYVVRMNIGYEKLGFNKILLKQKDSVQMILDNNSDVFKSFGTRYADLLNKHGYNVPEDMNIWDIVTPNLVMVPVEPIDSFSIVVRAENKLAKTGDDKFIYIAISLAISAAKQNSSNITDIINLDKKPQFSSRIIDNIGLLKESMKPVPKIGRTIQEGIDFGDADPDSSNPPAIDGGDSSSDNNSGDAVSDGGDNTDTSNDDGDAVQTDANDVSKEIAQNVADANAEKNNEDKTSADDSAVTGDGLDTPSTDIPEDDTDIPDESDASSEIPDDTAGGDLTDTGDVDAQLSDLDSMGNTDAELDGATNFGDMENMAPAEIKQAVQAKADTMPLSALKQFLQSDDGVLSGEDGTVTEAFVLTKKNINKELDAGLRKVLGDLNNDKLSAASIIHEFKKDGKKLNRVLTKASKMTDVYDEPEINVLVKLNKCLSDVIVSTREGMTPQEVRVFKRLVQAFTSQSKRVQTIIEKHKKDTFQQESTVDKFGLPIRNI